MIPTLLISVRLATCQARVHAGASPIDGSIGSWGLCSDETRWLFLVHASCTVWCVFVAAPYMMAACAALAVPCLLSPLAFPSILHFTPKANAFVYYRGELAGLPLFVATAWVGLLAYCLLSTVHASSVWLVAIGAHVQHSLSRCNWLLRRRTTCYENTTTAQTPANPRRGRNSTHVGETWRLQRCGVKLNRLPLGACRSGLDRPVANQTKALKSSARSSPQQSSLGTAHIQAAACRVVLNVCVRQKVACWHRTARSS